MTVLNVKLAEMKCARTLLDECLLYSYWPDSSDVDDEMKDWNKNYIVKENGMMTEILFLSSRIDGKSRRKYDQE